MTAPGKALLIGLVNLVLLTAFAVTTSANHGCWINEFGRNVCHLSGTITTSTPGRGAPTAVTADRPATPRPPFRYLVLGTLPGGGSCYSWSRVGGIDAWGPNDAAVISIISTRPRCPASPTGPAPRPPTAEELAWEVYRSWDLPAPTVAFSPPGGGITGFDTYLSTEPVTPLTHGEVLPSGATLQVEAVITGVDVDWGDGTVAPYTLADLAPYPAGAAVHVYAQKTCPPDYRASHPSGHLCHPSLEAYPVTVTYTWTARFQAGGPWIELESVPLSTTTPYDVDEVVGVLEG